VTDPLLLQGAIAGPAVAGVVWVVAWRLTGSRWPWIRRAAGGLVAVAAVAAGSVVLWFTYRGDDLRWRSYQPDLLGASVAVGVELAVLLAAVRADGPERWGPSAMAGLAVATSAVVASAFSRSLAVQAVVLPLPTLAAAVAAVAGRDRGDLRGILGLAAADGVALLGLSVVFTRVGRTLVGPEGGVLGGGLLMIAGAIKAGAVPGVGTWLLAATDGPGAPVSMALRGQGLALALLGGIVVVPGEPHAVTAAVAGAAVLVSGAAALAATTGRAAVTALSGAAAGVVFAALGLGGAVGTRAALVLTPPFLLAAGAAFTLGWNRREEVDVESRSGWRWLGAAALAVAVLTLAGLPPGGGFPGTWLTLSVAGARASSAAPYYLLAGAIALGLVSAALGAVPLLRASRARTWPAILGSVVAVALVYAGLAPARLGIGWWVRIERDLGVPVVLAASGPPDLPPLGVVNLALVLTEAVVLVGAVVALARGFRDVRVPFVAMTWPRPTPGFARRIASAIRPATERARRASVGLAAAVLLEAGAIVLAGRLVLLAARSGFL
jgi:hypothetical protein